jgi:hypothetical protein
MFARNGRLIALERAAESCATFLAFFLLLTTIYWLWWANHRPKELPVTDHEALFVAAVAAVGLTILWLDWRKT